MIMFCSSGDVRVYAAEAWMQLAERYAADHPLIFDRLDTILEDPVPTVRFQIAQNLELIGNLAPERMWAMAERIATEETDVRVLTSFMCSLSSFNHSAPERCEALLTIVTTRCADRFVDDSSGINDLCQVLGDWILQLFVRQARNHAYDLLTQWAADPLRFSKLLIAFVGALRATLFARYESNPAIEMLAISVRAQQAIELILRSATRTSTDAYAAMCLDTISEADKQQANARFNAAELVIFCVVNQLYFGSGAFKDNSVEDRPGLRDATTMSRFLTDYSDVLAMLADSRNPGVLHELIELYQFLIPADPSAVFGAVHAILVGHGEQEGYQYESLAVGVVFGIVRRYLADYLTIFEDPNRRENLVAILELFADAGWSDALQLLYELPELLR